MIVFNNSDPLIALIALIAPTRSRCCNSFNSATAMPWRFITRAANPA